VSKLPHHPDIAQLRRIEPTQRLVDTRQLWHRIYRRGGQHPTQWNALRFFGPTDARFDHHLPDDSGNGQEQPRGILYLASDVPTCLAEVYQANREVDTNDRDPWLVSFRLSAPLAVLDLTDTFPVQAGASMKLISGPRAYARNWARGLYEAYSNIDGLYFLSSMTNRPVLALFERATKKGPIPNTPLFHRNLDSPLLLIPIQEACKDIGYRLTPKTPF
jgi:RES domain-containing protein